MMNGIWLFLLLSGILSAAILGRIDLVFPAIIDGAVNGIDVVLGLCAFLAVWCGIMRLAEKSGLLDMFSKIAYPLLRRLFPDLSPNHKAWSPIVMNVTANFLGLGNAATPFGIKAMEELKKTSPQKDTATKEMITFLALNTSAVSIVPGLIMGLRTEAGSLHPEEIIIPSFLSSFIGLCAALLLGYLLGKGKKHGNSR